MWWLAAFVVTAWWIGFFLGGSNKHWGRFTVLTLLSWGVIGIVGLNFTATRGNAAQQVKAQIALDNLREARDDVAGAVLGTAIRLTWVANAVLPQDFALPSVEIVVSQSPTDPLGSAVQPRPTVSLAELRSRPLPLIPQEIRRVTAGDLVSLGAAEITVESDQTTVTVGGVISPTLSTDTSTANTRQWSRLIVEGLDPSLTLPITQTVTVQTFKDDTLLVSSRPISETVESWIRDVRFVAEGAHDLDIADKLKKDDNLRTELAQTWSSLRVTLEFNNITTDPAAMFGDKWTQTEKLVDRLQILPVAAGSYKFDIHQAPRGKDEGGTPELQALIGALRRQYFELSSRHRALADQIAQSKAKVDGPERKALLQDAEDLLWTVRDLKSKLQLEIALGTQYETVLLQWLNATEADLQNLVNNI